MATDNRDLITWARTLADPDWCLSVTQEAKNAIRRLADALEQAETRIAHQQEHQVHCYPLDGQVAYCGATHDCPAVATDEERRRRGTCVRCHCLAMKDGRRRAWLDAADLLDAEAPKHFRRARWLGAFGHYWGWRAAADRLRAQGGV